MSVTNVGLTESANYELTTGLRVYESGDGDAPSGRTIYLAWETEYGNPPNESFTLVLSFTGLLKGKSGNLPTKRWTITTNQSVITSKTIGNSNGRVRWFYPITKSTMSGLEKVNGGTWLYKDRICDTVSISAQITPNWGSNDPMGDGSKKGDTAFATLWVGYLANYSVVSAKYVDADTLAITYDTTWTRKDDRYAIKETSYVTDDGSRIMVYAGQWGTIEAPGLIYVDASCFTQSLIGKRVHFDMTFNPYYRPAAYFAQTWSGDLDVGVAEVCNGVSIAAVNQLPGYQLAIRCEDAGDYGLPCTHARIRVHGKGLDDWFVEKTIKLGSLASIGAVPLNVPLEVEAWGINNTAVSNRVVFKTIDAVEAPGLCIVQSTSSNSTRLLLKYNMSVTVDSEADVTTLKLAGRERSSAFYGDGGSKTISVTGDLLDEVGYTIERIPYLGDVHIFLPDGRVYRATATVDLSWEAPFMNRVKNVTVRGEEVSA